MPRVSEDEWTRKYGHGAFCHLAARTEGIMKEVIRYVGWCCVCMGSCTRLRHHAGFVYGAASSNDRRTNRSENRAAPPPFLLAFPFCLRCCFRLSFVCDLNDVILAVRKCRNGIFR